VIDRKETQLFENAFRCATFEGWFDCVLTLPISFDRRLCGRSRHSGSTIV